MLRYILLLMVPFIFSIQLFCVPLTTDYSTTQLMSSHSSIIPGETFYLAFTITPKKGWHTYWKNPGDSGLKTKFQWDLPDGFTAQETRWPNPKQYTLGPLINFGYSNTVQLITPIQVDPSLALDRPFTLSLKADWLVCETTCVPEHGSYTVTITTATQSVPSSYVDHISKTLQNMATPYLKPYTMHHVKESLEIYLMTPSKSIHSLYFYPEKNGIISPSSQQIISSSDDALVLKIPLKKEVSFIQGLLEIHYKDGSRKMVHLSGDLAFQKKGILFIMLLFSFVGGLLLNVMPCVFPVLSLKLLQLTSYARESKSLIRLHGLSYTVGVLLSMWLFALLIFILQVSGSAVGWGFHLQSPLVVLMLTYVMFYLTLYLLRLSPLPLFFYTVSGRASHIESSHHGSLLGSFLTGILTVIVATPCTAPFMASSIGFALTQPILITTLVFTSLGLGLAFPFLLIAYIPRLMACLPKPGSWMLSLQRFLALPMLASVMWLMWVLSTQLGYSSLIWVFLGCLLISMFSFYSRLKPLLSYWAWGLLFFSLLITGYIIHSQDILDIPATFSTQAIERSLENGRPVFVDVTASWCITCQTNKQLVLNSDEIQAAFKEHNVVFIVADWTNKNDTITNYLASFDRRGVPLYIYYPLEGTPKILPQLLSKDLILNLFKPY